ncbi:MAG: DUF3048 domain-containing protein [Bacilli bacterium]|nr:DUF3048 domain-containing protein [Bacilli bacterium]
MKNKKILVILMLVFSLLLVGCGKQEEPKQEEPKKEETKIEEPEKEEPVKEVSKFKIFDTTSKNRPFAIVVNNTPVAVKVQEGVTKAYLVYEFPTEGFTSRLMALFKDVPTLTVGTIRSCRHNFIDFAQENDAVLVCYGWSHYAKDELEQQKIAYINGISSRWSSLFWRSNPEKLASEHTAYTSIEKVYNYAKGHNYRLTSDKSRVLNYTPEEVNLNNMNKAITANTVTLPYGNITTVFKYDKNTKEYVKYVNNKEIKDHNTGEHITTKNIIIQKITYKMASDHYYWDLHTTGTGDGYYITNGYAVPIKWSKKTRDSKSIYTYLDGKEIEVNDGRTYIEVHTTKKKHSIK